MSEETKEHLKGLTNVLACNHPSYPPAEGDFSEIAFKLLELTDGENKAAVSRVAKYIKQQHSDLKKAHAQMGKLRNEVEQWVRWAEVWTVPKENK